MTFESASPFLVVTLRWCTHVLNNFAPFIPPPPLRQDAQTVHNNAGRLCIARNNTR